MQKLKKALTKLAKLGTSTPAQAAKKASTVKKKTAPAAAPKKAAPKKPAAPVKKAGSKPAPKVVKAAKGVEKPSAAGAPKAGQAKDLKKKAAPPAPPAKAAKPVEKTPAKPGKKVLAQPSAAPATKKVEAKEAKPVEKEAPSKELEAKEAAKAAKAKKPREEAGREEVAAPEAPEEVVLTDAEGRRYCRVKDCDQIASVEAYCRFHYLLFWKNIQNRKKILSEGKLERYVEELTARYPDKFLELLRKDLRSEKDFLAAIQELEIDDTGVDTEYEDEAQSYLEEVRGMSGEGGGREEEEF